jgi:hypothetical protein
LTESRLGGGSTAKDLEFFGHPKVERCASFFGADQVRVMVIAPATDHIVDGGTLAADLVIGNRAARGTVRGLAGIPSIF